MSSEQSCRDGISGDVISEKREMQRPVDKILNSETKKTGQFSHFIEVLTTLSVFAVSIIIGAVAFRNTLTHYLQLFWGVSGDFWMSQWARFYDLCEGDVVKIGLGVHAAFILEHWIVGGLFLIVDLTGWPEGLAKYKVQPEQTTIPPGKLRKVLITAFLNQTVYSLPPMVAIYYMMMWRGCGFAAHELPTFHWALFELLVFVIMVEIGFYYLHRLFHLPFFYKTFHKKHHEWTAPIGLITLYSHPVEHIFSNVLPAALGPLLMGSHVASLMTWGLIAQLVSMITHSGYHLPFLVSPEFHDYHHLKFNNCFGVLGILDRLHSTDANFRKSKQYQRHFTLLGLTPAAELIPDDPKQK